MPSFDAVSEINWHEVTNAIDQANRELESRFDFRGSQARFFLEKKAINLECAQKHQLEQMRDILKLRLAKRGIDLVALDEGTISDDAARPHQVLTLREGINADAARVLQKAIKDSKLKVTASILGDKLRVSGKSRDELQSTMALMRKCKIDVSLQFDNFRD
jgi:cyclic-di-GMP-binding protein